MGASGGVVLVEMHLAPHSVVETPGLPTLPSDGSAGHASGDCQPCAFFHSGRCSNAKQCKFCHLCDDSERKRRKKVKLELQRKAKQAARSVVADQLRPGK